MDTSSVAYNYAIAFTLFKSINMKGIKEEIIQLTIVKYNVASLGEIKLCLAQLPST